MKTPDEIKKGMEHCAGSRPCAECAYDNRDFPYCIMRQRTDALAYIQQLEARVPRWISVEEKLPEECLYVIVYLQNKRTDNKDIWHIDADFFEDGDWHRYPESGYYNVTHWMPLPEPPKEDAT